MESPQRKRLTRARSRKPTSTPLDAHHSLTGTEYRAQCLSQPAAFYPHQLMTTGFALTLYWPTGCTKLLCVSYKEHIVANSLLSVPATSQAVVNSASSERGAVAFFPLAAGCTTLSPPRTRTRRCRTVERGNSFCTNERRGSSSSGKTTQSHIAAEMHAQRVEFTILIWCARCGAPAVRLHTASGGQVAKWLAGCLREGGKKAAAARRGRAGAPAEPGKLKIIETGDRVIICV